MEKEIWKERAENYNKLQWVNDDNLNKSLLDFMQLQGNHTVLSAGIGTGMFAKLIVPFVHKVYGVDGSQDMVDLIDEQSIFTKISDLRDIPFEDNFFDRIIFRHVLHHCCGYVSKCIDEAYRVLKPDGKIIICESVPVNNLCVSDFSQIVSVKENRLVFTDEDLLRLLFRFKDVQETNVLLQDQSIDDWLSNCGVSKDIYKRTMDAHLRSSDKYRSSANMKIKGKDITVNMRFMAVRGQK